MMEYSKGHTDISLDFEGYFKGLSTKADRIGRALFLITNYLSHKDMIERLQSLGIDFIEVSYMFHPLQHEHHHYALKNLECLLAEVKTLTNALTIIGTLSVDNKNVLHLEIDSFSKTVSEYMTLHRTHLESKNGIPSPVFDTEFFGDAVTLPQIETSQKEKSTNTKPTSFTEMSPNFSKGHDEKQSSISKGHDSLSDGVKKASRTDMVDRINRKTSILNFIKQNKEVAIKDIQNHISDCSEKTIQRELNDLIKDGVLKKEGDRRWSKYSLLKDK